MTKNNETGSTDTPEDALGRRIANLRKREATILHTMQAEARLLAVTIEQQNDWPPVTWSRLIFERLDKLQSLREALAALDKP